MKHGKQLLWLGALLVMGLCLSIPWSNAQTDPVIEGRALWATQSPKNESGIEIVIIESFKITVDDDNTSYVCGNMQGGQISFGDITVYTEPFTFSGFVLALYPNGTEKFVITVNATGEVFCYGLTIVSDGFFFSGSFAGNFTGDFASQFPESELKDISDDSGQTTRGFLVKYHRDGTVFSDSLNILGSVGYFTEIMALGSDSEDSVYLVGNFNGNVSVGPETLHSSGILSGFYAKYSEGTFHHAQAFGGNGSTLAIGISTNSEGYSCIVGSSTETATIGNATIDSAPYLSVYFQQLNPDGTQVWFDRLLTDDSTPYGVDIDERRACSFSGPFEHFLEKSNNERIEVPGTGSFFAKYRPDGNNVVLDTTRGDVLDIFYDQSCSDTTGSCYVTGFYSGNITFQGVTYSNDGSDQYFVAKFDNDGNFSGLINGTGLSAGESLYTMNDNLWVTGLFSQQLIIDNFQLSSIADTSMFTVRYT